MALSIPLPATESIRTQSLAGCGRLWGRVWTHIHLLVTVNNLRVLYRPTSSVRRYGYNNNKDSPPGSGAPPPGSGGKTVGDWELSLTDRFFITGE